jgi:hypothetical protein
MLPIWSRFITVGRRLNLNRSDASVRLIVNCWNGEAMLQRDRLSLYLRAVV